MLSISYLFVIGAQATDPTRPLGARPIGDLSPLGAATQSSPTCALW